jgi:hypothetical protein
MWSSDSPEELLCTLYTLSVFEIKYCTFNVTARFLTVTGNIEDGLPCLLYFYYELWINILGELFT